MHALFAIESARVLRGMPPKLESWRTARWMGPWSDKHAPEDTTTIGDWPIVSGGKEVPALQAPQAAAKLAPVNRINKRDQAFCRVVRRNATGFFSLLIR
jgi:hypothetical protein